MNEQPDDTKRLWSHRNELLLEHDVLTYQTRKPLPEYAVRPSLDRCLVVPNKWRKSLVTFFHAAKNMAHAGPYQTYRRLLTSYWWPSMQNDIKSILANCDTCQRVKTGPTNMHAPLQPITTDDVFERVHIDLIGPMANSHGYKYVLVIIDAFSRWIEAVPLTNKRADTVAWALLTTWICRYGWMKILHSDNGTEFVNAIMTDICNWLGIIRTTTTAYHPQGNGMCERANRSLKQALTCLLLEYGTGWFKSLPFALWSIRSAIHRVTGYSPYQVLFARHMRTPYEYTRTVKIAPTTIADGRQNTLNHSENSNSHAEAPQHGSLDAAHDFASDEPTTTTTAISVAALSHKNDTIPTVRRPARSAINEHDKFLTVGETLHIARHGSFESARCPLSNPTVIAVTRPLRSKVVTQKLNLPDRPR